MIDAPPNYLLQEVRSLLLRRRLDETFVALHRIVSLPTCTPNDHAEAAMLEATCAIIKGRYVGDSVFFEQADQALAKSDEILERISSPNLRTQSIRQCTLMARALLFLHQRQMHDAWQLFEHVRELNFSWTRERLVSTFGLARIAESTNEMNHALALVQEGREVMERYPDLNTPEAEVESLTLLSKIYFKQQNYSQSLFFAQQLLESSRKYRTIENEIFALCDIAAIKGIQSDYKLAVQMLIDAYEKAQQIGFRSQAAKCLINIGTIHAQLHSYAQARARYETALQDFSDVLSTDARGALHNNIASTYSALGDLPSAFEHLEKALEYMQKNNNRSQIAYILSLMGRNYLQIGEFDKAAEVVDKANFYYDKTEKVMLGRQIHLINLAEMAFLSNDHELVFELAHRGCAVARWKMDATSELRALKLMAENFKKQNNYKRAFHCQNLFAKIQEEYLKKRRDLQMLSLEIQFSLKEKQQTIERLTKENALQSELLKQKSQIEQQNDHLKQVNSELQQFAFITSHDLKEPLRMIKSFTQIIEKKTAPLLEKEGDSYFQYINEGVTRMGDLLDALLQYATIGRSAEIDNETVNLNGVVRAARNNLKIKIEESDANILCGELPVLQSKKSFLVQLFQNLIGNALKFRKPDTRPIILINAEEAANEWIFSVQDNGIGIAKEHLDRIFIIFQRLHTRTEYEGTGIGLAICQKIVLQLGGRIWVESAPEKGATFFFTLPKYEE